MTSHCTLIGKPYVRRSPFRRSGSQKLRGCCQSWLRGPITASFRPHLDLGFTFVGIGADVSFVNDGVKAALAAARGH